jgi:hypothetical protein
MVERVKVTSPKKQARVDRSNEDRDFAHREVIGDDWDEFMGQLEKGLTIDEYALNEGVIAQPELFYKVSQQLASQTSLRDDAKHQLEVTEAEVDATIRLYHRKNEEKVTENEIKAKIASHRDVVSATKLFLQQNKRVGELAALKEAFNQRNFMLKGLIDLYIGNYYGNVPGDGSHGSKTTALRRAEYGEDRKALNEARSERGKV